MWRNVHIRTFRIFGRSCRITREEISPRYRYYSTDAVGSGHPTTTTNNKNGRSFAIRRLHRALSATLNTREGRDTCRLRKHTVPKTHARIARRLPTTLQLINKLSSKETCQGQGGGRERERESLLTCVLRGNFLTPVHADLRADSVQQLAPAAGGVD